MSKFDFPPSIASRPVYGTLKPRKGTQHLMIADGAGAEALLDLVASAPEIMAQAHVIFISRGSDTHSEKLRAAGPAILHVGPSYPATVQRIRRVLQDTVMGAQIYLAGTEGLIGQAMNEALQAGIPLAAIQTEHRGSVARRVQCVHCKGITEGVMTDPFVCSHCGLNLFVRDHYSRRLAAFQGVCIDAEDPGEVPDPVELYK
ncbi:MAG: hypothetical protein JJU07_00135 [Natronohydrobacter sp.]|nr:hypothetical protein [Natronohydrobacter sp.]MCC5964630.1 hypothetical protein [Natronohydrobacter sp.]